MQHDSGKIGTRWVVAVVVVMAAVVAVVALVRLDTTGRTSSRLSDEFAYDISKLARIDPNLILYEPSRPPVSTGFRRSRAIGLDAQGRIYVAGDRAIHTFSEAGLRESTIALSGEPQSLTVSDEGRIYVGLADHIEVLDPNGQRIASWESLGDEAVLTSIATYRDSVFVADAGHRIVLHYDTAGALIGHIGEKDPDRNVPGFVIPGPHFDLAVSRDGLLRVVNPGRLRIEAYTLDGDLEFWWGEPSTAIEGFCGCCNPVNFALLPNGWFVTSEKGLLRVKLYDSDGAFVGVVAGPAQLADGRQVTVCNTPEECQDGSLDVAAGADGRIYVLDTTENIIKVFKKRESRL